MMADPATAEPAPDELKRRAAQAAAAEVEDGMVLGLGSGSTAMLVVEALAARIAREHLKVVGIPSSQRTAALAQSLGVQLTTFAEHRTIDLTIDGADQVESGSLNLIKGLGGALLREKIVAAASRRMLVVVDQSKLVDRLGSRTPLPVEVAGLRLADSPGPPGRAASRPDSTDQSRRGRRSSPMEATTSSTAPSPPGSVMP